MSLDMLVYDDKILFQNRKILSLHIAITTLWFPDDKNPLYGVFILNQAEKLAEHVDVTVMVSRRKLLPYKKRYKIGKVNVVERGGPYLPNTNEKRLTKWSSYYEEMFEEVNQLCKVDLIHCHDYIALYPTRLINKKYNIPYVVTIHNTDFLRGRVDSWREPYLKDCFDHSEKVISVGESLSEELAKYTNGSNIQNIPNIIDTEMFSYAVPVELPPFKFLYVGNYEARKRVLVLLEAFHLLNHEDANLTCIGFGEQKKQMVQFVESNNLKSKVDVLDIYPNNELPQFYQSHHCYVSISEAETFGITVVEAMSCGMHILYSKSGGPEHLVPDYGTMLIENVTAVELALKMKEIIETYDANLSMKIRKHAVDHFSSGMVIGQIVNLYNKVLSE